MPYHLVLGVKNDLITGEYDTAFIFCLGMELAGGMELDER